MGSENKRAEVFKSEPSKQLHMLGSVFLKNKLSDFELPSENVRGYLPHDRDGCGEFVFHFEVHIRHPMLTTSGHAASND
jgi:hypothetical protein